MTPDNDVVDLREVAFALRRGWHWIVAGALGGLLLAALITWLLRPEYEADVTVLLRSGTDASSPLGGGARGSSGGGLSLGGLADVLSLASGFDTEIEILTSRSVIGAVVDSLGLQARVLDPRGVGTLEIFSTARWDPDLEAASYSFEREGDGYRISGPGVSAVVIPGEPFRLRGSVFTLRGGELPEAFEIELRDRQEAIARVREKLEADRAGGDVAQLVFRAGDPLVAAAVPNAMVARYLARRRTSDRGVNQQRYEFLEVRTDSIRMELARAERALRGEQEASGVLDPELYGKAEMEQGLELRAELEAAEVEARAFGEVLSQADAGTLSPRDLAAYPTFLGNSAINNLLSRLLELETERTALLDRRTEQDPDVVIRDQQIDQLEDQLVAMSSAYLSGLDRQQAELRRELSRYDAVLDALPAQAEANYRARREVERLSETLIALQNQLVQARLAAIAEGGDVRLVDPAVPPRAPAFPRPLLSLGIGLFGGLLLGAVGALGSFYTGSRVRDARDAELAAGVPALSLDHGAPLLLGKGGQQSMLVVPIGDHAGSERIARRIAANAARQGENVVLANLEGMALPRLLPERTDGTAAEVPSREVSAGPAERPHLESRPEPEGYFSFRASQNGNGRVDPRAVIEGLERRFSVVVTALPGFGDFPTPALLSAERPVILAAHAGKTSRVELQDAVLALQRLGIDVSVVVADDSADAGRSRSR